MPSQDMQKKLEYLIAKVTSAPNASGKRASGEVADELDQLLWLFAEDELSHQDEERMWQLVATEPMAVGHFRAMIDSLSRLDAKDLSKSPDAVRARLTSTQKLSSKKGSSAILPTHRVTPQQIVDLVVRVAREFLELGEGFSPRIAMATRDTNEKSTSISKQFLRKIGIGELVVDHAGDSRCDLKLLITEASELYPQSTLSATILDESQAVLETAALRDGQAIFRNLPVGFYSIAVAQAGEEVDRLSVAIQAMEDANGETS